MSAAKAGMGRWTDPPICERYGVDAGRVIDGVDCQQRELAVAAGALLRRALAEAVGGQAQENARNHNEKYKAPPPPPGAHRIAATEAGGSALHAAAAARIWHATAHRKRKREANQGREGRAHKILQMLAWVLTLSIAVGIGLSIAVYRLAISCTGPCVWPAIC